MNREVHVRFWERLEVKLLRATRHLRSSCALPSDGSLSPDSFRARRMLVTEKTGHLQPSRSDVADGQLILR